MSRLLITIVLGILVGAGLAAFADPATVPSVPSQALAGRDRMIDEVVFDALPLSKVWDRLAQDHRLNIVISSDLTGIDRNTPITLRLYDVKARQVISAVLQQLQDSRSVGYRYVDNIFYIGPWSLEGSELELRMYDVSDLIVRIHNSLKEGNRETTREEAVESLTTLLQVNVMPNTWQINGGTIGSLSELMGNLVITTTPDIHLGVESLLRDLRRGAVQYPSTQPTDPAPTTSKLLPRSVRR